jgi:hypothetical protein
MGSILQASIYLSRTNLNIPSAAALETRKFNVQAMPSSATSSLAIHGAPWFQISGWKGGLMSLMV